MLFKRVLINIKHSSNATLKAWSYQCESILAQRSRRLQQLFTFYHRVYGSQGLKLLFRSYHRQLPQFKGEKLVLSAVGVLTYLTGGSGFDWNSERLSLSNFDTCHRDLEFINAIHRNKLCERCKEYKMKHCYCLVGNKENAPSESRNFNRKTTTQKHLHKNEVDIPSIKGSALIKCSKANWEPFFCTNEFDIWKREERPDRYSYKVYTSYKDISAADLLYVQLDLDYRKKWDDNAVDLHIIEEDPVPGTNSHLIYWEMLWPKFFNNRDYVYCRRYICDDQRKVMIVANRGTQHPQYPQSNGKVRVTDYWSFVVIKPFRGFQEPGCHYIITYFDDPGVPIPHNIKSWVIQKQMPDSLKQMYHATKNYSYKKALAMKDVFNSLSMLNDDYEPNKLRANWLKSLWRKHSNKNVNKGE